MLNDTISAIATGQQKGAISIVRISGEDSFPIIQKLVDIDLSKAEGNTIHHAWIKDNDEVVDEVVLNVFRAPNSFTGEDVIEVNCHGGVYITRKILSLILGNGARLANPGEFSQRAYLNNKIDLSQAEAINDLINAKNELSASSAANSLRGSTAKLIAPLEEELTQIISNIEANIDYPEYYDVKQVTEEEILPAIDRWLEQMDKIVEDAKQSITIREGVDTAILGKPNVGKSSILNALLNEDKAIVTDIAGTTRDLVEGVVTVGGVPLNLIDTAGIRESDDVVEKIGIERSLQALDKAQLVIVVLDDSNELDEEDKEILERTKDKERIIVYNKMDLGVHSEGVHTSAIQGDVEELQKAIEEKFKDALPIAKENTLNNERQLGLALRARSAMLDAKKTLTDGFELDVVTIDLQKCWESLREITGQVHRDDLLDEIFSRFCLGK